MSKPNGIYRILRWLRIAVSLLVISVLTATVSWGVMWCPWIYEWIDRVQILPAAVRLGKRKRVYRYSPPRTLWRYSMLVVTLACLLAGFWLAVSLLDPYELYVRFCTDTIAPASRAVVDAGVCAGVSHRDFVPILLTSLTATALSALLLLAVLIIAARSGRSICNTLCPVGTMLGLISRYSVWQMDIDTDLCTQCRKCEDVCKGGCINLTDHVVDGSRCVMCMDCVNVCENNAINYTWRRKQLADPMMQRIGKPKASASVMEQSSNCINKSEK